MKNVPQTYFEMRFAPNFVLVTQVRRFVESIYSSSIKNLEGISRLALVTHELLENGVRYSTNGETTIRIEIDDNSKSRNVRVRIWNQATAENIEGLTQLIAELQRAPSPLLFYVELMKRGQKDLERSGLGLARIAAEAEMDLSLEITGSTVCLGATGVVEATDVEV